MDVKKSPNLSSLFTYLFPCLSNFYNDYSAYLGGDEFLRSGAAERFFQDTKRGRVLGSVCFVQRIFSRGNGTTIPEQPYHQQDDLYALRGVAGGNVDAFLLPDFLRVFTVIYKGEARYCGNDNPDSRGDCHDICCCKRTACAGKEATAGGAG